MKFKITYAISLAFFILKMVLSILGFIFPSKIASKVVEIAGVSSIMHSRTVTTGMSKYVYVVVAVLALSSILSFIGVWFMKRKIVYGFWFYALIQVITAAMFMYCGFNIYAGIQYLSLFGLFGIGMYIFNWEYFSKRS